jgi:hypothetical protein
MGEAGPCTQVAFKDLLVPPLSASIPALDRNSCPTTYGQESEISGVDLRDADPL